MSSSPAFLLLTLFLTITFAVKVVVIVLPLIRHTLDVTLGSLPPVESLPNKLVVRHLFLPPPLLPVLLEEEGFSPPLHCPTQPIVLV